MPNSLPRPFSVFQDRFNSLEEVVQTIYVDAGKSEYKIDVCKTKHSNDPDKDHFVAKYFVKQDDRYVEDRSDLPWADGHTKDGALAEALGFIAERHPRQVRKSG
jgi:hypothetical protein